MKMKPSMINRLRQATPKKRVKIINKLYNKNLGYFTVKHPAISEMLNKVSCPYQINLTENFLEIIDSRDNQLIHPEIGLDRFAESLGDWTHSAWVEFIDPVLKLPPEDFKHGRTVRRFCQAMLDSFPEFCHRFDSLKINLPVIGDGIRYSNPVAFLGIFNGLHIDYYLSRTHVSSAVFVEPEPHRFELSCYFLDYEELDRRLNGLLLHVGDNPADILFNTMIRKSMTTSTVWTRILPGYASESFEPIIRQLRMRWLALSDEWIPADREFRSFSYAKDNLANKLPLLVNHPQLSSGSRIVVVGAGPSLNKDLDWLFENQDRLIIFAVHSALIPLRKRGIRPDFQFNLDLEMNYEGFLQHQFDYEIPFVVDYRTDPKLLKHFRHVLMVAAETKTSHILVENTIRHTEPTTGNLAVALACYFRPAELYLLGMDLGFRKLGNTHVRGGFYDIPGNDAEAKGQEQWEANANFPDAAPIFTRPQFDTARAFMEEALAEIITHTTSYNLSDGVRVQGATPRRPEETYLPPYPEKKEDIGSLYAVFQPPVHGTHWHPHPVPGSKILDHFRTTLIAELHLESIDWIGVTGMLDTALKKTAESCQQHSTADFRMVPYFRLILDLIISWYRFMIFANTPAEIEHLYTTGLKLIAAEINDFTWPDGLE